MKYKGEAKKGLLYVFLMAMFWVTTPFLREEWMDKALVDVDDFCDYTIGLNVSTADGWDNYNEVAPGDTVCIQSGNRNALKLKNFKGTAAKPIIFINSEGKVVISSSSWYGIIIQNSQYVRLTGTGSEEIYGLKIVASQNHGIRIGWKSSDFEIDHVEVMGVPGAGIHAKTNGVCLDGTTNDYDYDRDGRSKGDQGDVVDRSNFVQRNSVFHHNYLHNIGTEGFYIGSSEYTSGVVTSCAGGSQIIDQPLLNGVHIYNNQVEETGWDGIQVGSATKDCTIHHNIIYRDSTANKTGQQSGIMNNPGSVCDIYSNYLKESGSRGIYIQGNGGNQVHDNVIVDPTRLHNNSGIIIGGSNRGGNLAIFNNTIINAAENGINYRNNVGTNNIIKNNLIINPGKGVAGAVETGGRTKVRVLDNYVTMNIDEVQFMDPATDDYRLLAESPAFRVGADLNLQDLESNDRFDGPYLQVETMQTNVFSGDSITVQIRVNDVTALYGLQVTCEVDPAILSLQGAQFKDFFTTPLGGAANIDASTGVWVGAISQKDPALALSGSGPFATLTFETVGIGTTSVNCEPLASDRNGFELPINSLGDSITVIETKENVAVK